MLRRAQALESAWSPCVAFRHDTAFCFYTAVDTAQTCGFLSQLLIWPSPAGTSYLICFTGELSICLFFVIILNTNCHTLSLCTHQSTATISLQLGVPPYQTLGILRGAHNTALLLTLWGQYHLRSTIFLTWPVLGSDPQVHTGITQGGHKISEVQAPPRWITSELPEVGAKCAYFLKVPGWFWTAGECTYNHSQLFLMFPWHRLHSDQQQLPQEIILKSENRDEVVPSCLGKCDDSNHWY